MDIVYLYVTYLNDPEILFWLIFLAGSVIIVNWYECNDLSEEGDDE